MFELKNGETQDFFKYTYLKLIIIWYNYKVLNFEKFGVQL